MRGPDGDPGAEPGAGEVGDILVREEAAAVDGDDVIGRTGGLLGVGGGVQDRAALGGMGAQQPVQPAVLARGETLGGFVEDEGVRVPEQG